MIKGAEAEIKIKGNKVVKKRVSKDYRHTEIDEQIRKERTQKEMGMMNEARKYGAQVPEIEQIDPTTLEIEKIEGKQLKDVIERDPGKIEKLGENTARMHEANVIHGDLTTRNAIVSGEEVYLIDFGLAERSDRIEDMATDLHLLKQVLESSHPGIAEEAWQKFRESYLENNGNEKVLERLSEVEKRGRYK